MCQNCVAKQQNRLMVGLTENHRDALVSQMHQDKPFIDAVYAALTKALTPHLPILPMFVAMYRFLLEGRYGVLADHHLVRVPLSVIPADRKRYRTPIIGLLHEAVLSFRMSEHTVDAVNAAMRPFGVGVLYLCSCGVVMGSLVDIGSFRGSPVHLRMDRLRSAIDVEGNPVVEARNWNDIPMPNMDIAANGSEIALFEMISDLSLAAARENQPDFPWIEPLLQEYISRAGSTRDDTDDSLAA